MLNQERGRTWVEGSGVRALVVDDDPAVARMVALWLAREGLEVEVAGSATEALELMARVPCGLVFSDIHMPGQSGLELAGRVKALDPAIQVIIMTGSTDVESAIEALRLHADDYLVKPFEPALLLHAARRTLEHRRLLLENRAYREDLEARVSAQARRLERTYLTAIHSLVRALEAKDPSTRGHSDRVAEFAAALATEFPDLDPDLVRVGARLHDIGKIGIHGAVLRKPGPLTVDEMDHVRSHPIVGEQILAPMLEDRTVLDIVRHHHERWDGLGYPDGLKAEAIPLAARVVAVADTFDAMTTSRPYRPALSAQQAIAEILAEAGRQFDPAVAAAAARTFLEAVELAS